MKAHIKGFKIWDAGLQKKFSTLLFIMEKKEQTIPPPAVTNRAVEEGSAWYQFSSFLMSDHNLHCTSLTLSSFARVLVAGKVLILWRC